MSNRIKTANSQVLTKFTNRSRQLFMVGLWSSILIFMMEGKPAVYSTFAAIFCCIFNTVTFVLIDAKNTAELKKLLRCDNGDQL